MHYNSHCFVDSRAESVNYSCLLLYNWFMAKSEVLFVCSECGNEFTKWQGQCPVCKAWNSFKEAPSLSSPRSKSGSRLPTKQGVRSVPLDKKSWQDVQSKNVVRLSSEVGEVDRVLGGESGNQGFVPGAVILLAGEPGIGKSTILTQICILMGSSKKQLGLSGTKEGAQDLGAVLYVSGEESVEQVGFRIRRLQDSLTSQRGNDKLTQTKSHKNDSATNVFGSNIFLANSSDVDSVVDDIRSGSYRLVIVDSIQTLATGDVPGLAGSISQIRESALRLIQAAKEKGAVVVLVGHVTKEGTIAGPRLLEHMVDVVLSFEGDRQGGLRLLRGVKNRFGATHEVGIFAMGEAGLEEVTNPSELLVDQHERPVSGSVVTVLMEGTRPLLVEIQALVVRSFLPMPRRVTSGYDLNRLQTLLAVITKRVGINFNEEDVYVNVVGGMRVREPAVDAAVCAAVISAKLDRPLAVGQVIIGEVGLSGELRGVPQAHQRGGESRRLGYETIKGPILRKGGSAIPGYHGVRDLRGLVQELGLGK